MGNEKELKLTDEQKRIAPETFDALEYGLGTDRRKQLFSAVEAVLNTRAEQFRARLAAPEPQEQSGVLTNGRIGSVSDTVTFQPSGYAQQFPTEQPPERVDDGCLCIMDCSVNGMCPVHGDRKPPERVPEPVEIAYREAAPDNYPPLVCSACGSVVYNIAAHTAAHNAARR